MSDGTNAFGGFSMILLSILEHSAEGEGRCDSTRALLIKYIPICAEGFPMFLRKEFSQLYRRGEGIKKRCEGVYKALYGTKRLIVEWQRAPTEKVGEGTKKTHKRKRMSVPRERDTGGERFTKCGYA